MKMPRLLFQIRVQPARVNLYASKTCLHNLLDVAVVCEVDPRVVVNPGFGFVTDAVVDIPAKRHIVSSCIAHQRCKVCKL